MRLKDLKKKKQLEKVLEERDTNIKSYQDVHQSVSDALIQAQQAENKQNCCHKRIRSNYL